MSDVEPTVVPAAPLASATGAADELLSKEYFTLVDLVTQVDQRLLTIKGWGVTVGLALLATGFQAHHRGVFLVAALGGVCFWTLEGAFKTHQRRYYVRMREIEVQHACAASCDRSAHTAPQIDWSWSIAPLFLAGDQSSPVPPAPQRYPAPGRTLRLSPRHAVLCYLRPFGWPHVFLPHALSIVAGAILFSVLPMPL